MQNALKKKNLGIYLLFAIVIFIWSIGWSINKMGLLYMPAIWFGVFRVGGAAAFLFFMLGISGQLHLPRAKDIPIILSIGLLQMGLFIIFINLGLFYVEAGRSAILAYTTPLWTTPIATLFFKEKLSMQKFLGLCLGVLGILVLFSPFSLDWHNTNELIGNSYILLSAILWSLAMICTRYMKWYSSPIQLLPWQFLVGFFPTFLLAIYLAPSPHIQWCHQLYAILFVTIIFISAFAYWGFILVTKNLPVTTSSMGLLAIPLTSLLASHIITGEVITLNKTIAMVLIMLGLALATLFNSEKRT